MSKLQQRRYCFTWVLITIFVLIGFTGNSTNMSLSGNIANAGNSESLQLHTLAKVNSTTLYKAPCAKLNANDNFILVNKLGFLDSASDRNIDNATNTVYLWTSKGDNLSYNRVFDSSVENGIINLITDYRFDSEYQFCLG